MSFDESTESTDSGEPRSLREHLAMAALEAKLTGRSVQPMIGGRYAILEIIGSGGMGEVCRAIDRELQREVAVKLVRTTGDVERARRRLAGEAKALARLSDSHVVPVFDIVADPLGLCVVMELVRGVDLRTWLRATPRSIAQILDVLTAAGQGIAAAHRAGVIHRDIKPDNVMVGDDGGVRVVDFGLAQPVEDDERSSETSTPGDALTQHGMLVGTAGYIAPELYRGRPADARSDQLGWCVMAYEALWGTRPVSPTTVAALAQRGAVAWRVEPPPDERRVPRSVAAVVMRGLAADPEARFSDVDALLAALHRARSRRPRAIVITLASTALATTVVLASTRSPARCDGDDARLAAVWTPAREAALRSAFASTELPYAGVAADRVADVIGGRVAAFGGARTQACAAGRDAVEIDTAIACLHDRRDDLDARIALYLAADRDIVAHAVESAAALPDPRVCVDPADGDRETLSEAQRLLRRDLDRAIALAAAGKPADARALAIEVHASLRDAGDAAGAGDATRLLGEIASDLGDYAGATTSFETAYFDATARGDGPRAFSAAADLVGLHAHRSVRLDDAQSWLRHLQALAQHIPSPEREARLASSRAGVLLATGQFDAAIAGYRDAIARLEAIDGASSPRLVWARQDLALTYARGGDPIAADHTFTTVLVEAEAIWGAAHPEYASILENHANVVDAVGRGDRALSMHMRVLEIRRAALGEQHPDVGASLTNIGAEHEARGDHGLARDVLERALAVQRAALGPAHPSVAITLNNLGNVLGNLGEIGAAQDAYDLALEITERAFGPDDPRVALLLSNLGTCHEARGAHGPARIVLLRSLAIRERVFGVEHTETAYALHNLGVVELAAGRPAEAIVLLERAVPIRQRAGDAYLLATSQQSLAEALVAERGHSPRTDGLSTAARATFVTLGRTAEIAQVDAWRARRSTR